MVTFALPTLLFGLSAVAAPLLIHWFFRPRARRVRFPAATLMAAALASGRRAQRVRDLWLLLLRVLLVAAIVLLLSGPVRPGATVEEKLEGPAAVAVVVDESASTLYEVGEKETLRDQIFDHAGEIVDRIADQPPGTVATVLFSGSAGRTGPATDDFSAMRRELAARRDRPADANTLAAAIGSAVRLLADARPKVKELVVVTDLAAHAWRDVEPAALRAMPDVRVRIVAPAPGPRTNLALSLAAPPRRILPDTGGAPFSVNITCTGVGAVASLVVRDGATVLDRIGALELDADRSRSVVLTLPERTTVTHQLSVMVEPSDRLTFDQVAWVAWQTGPRPSAWFVRPARLAPVDETSELIWRNLLAPEALPEADRPLMVRIFDDRRGIDAPVDAASTPDLIVVLSDIDLNDPARRAIVSAVEGGSVLLLACGGGASPDWPGLRRMVLAAPPLVERMDATQTLAWSSEAAELVTLEPGVEELARTPIRRRLAVESDGGTVVEARFSDGRAAILSRRVGKGEVILLAASPDPGWSDLGLRAAGLLSWLNSLALRHRPEADRAANFTLGERSDRAFAGLPDRGVVTVRAFGAAEGVHAAIEAGRPVDGWPTRSPGGFEIVAAGGTLLARYAVNWPVEESDLSVTTAERIASVLGVESVSLEQPGGSSAARLGGLRSLFDGLIDPHVVLSLALLAVLVGEAWLSARRRPLIEANG